MCSRYATLCNSSRTSTFAYHVSYFENYGREKRLPSLANLQRRDGSRLLILSVYRRVTTTREWLERILSLRLLLLPILSRWLPSRRLRARLSLPLNARHGRNRDCTGASFKGE